MGRIGLLFVLVMWFVAPTSAGAQGVADIADELDESGFYIENGADVDAGEVRALAGRLDRDGVGLGVVILDGEPIDGSENLALDLDDELRTMDTNIRSVIVLSPADVGAASQEFSDAELDAAFDASIDAIGEDSVSGLEAFARALRTGSSGADASGNDVVGGPSQVPVPTTSAPSGGGGGFSLWPILAALGIGGGGFWWWSRRKREKAVDLALDRERQEVQDKIDDAADLILDLDDEVAILDEATRSGFQEATNTYREVDDALDDATTVAELDVLEDRMDVALWQLEVADAQIDGDPIPPKPEPRLRRPEPERTLEPVPPEVRRRRRAPTRPRSGRRGGSRRGGSRGGGLGGLGGMLGPAILGGMLGRGQQGRQRRSGGSYSGGGRRRSSGVPRVPSMGGSGRRSGSSQRKRGSAGRRRGRSGRGRSGSSGRRL